MSSFGQYLRASRLGYHLDPVLQTWARVRADRPDPPYIVDLVPAHEHVPTDPRPGQYVQWWDGTDSLTTHSPRLRELGVITTKLTLGIGEHGEEVPVPAPYTRAAQRAARATVRATAPVPEAPPPPPPGWRVWAQDDLGKVYCTKNHLPDHILTVALNYDRPPPRWHWWITDRALGEQLRDGWTNGCELAQAEAEAAHRQLQEPTP